MWKDLFSADSQSYAQFRPHYPAALFHYLSSLPPAHALAWDCATGNGQAARALAASFDQVIATDASAQQLKYAHPHPKIRYLVAKAEHAPLLDKSVDLITVAQAFHWFNHHDFLTEVRRVLKPDGVLAIWCYDLCTITPAIDEVVYEYYHHLLGPYWEKERRFIEEGYQKNPFLCNEITTPSFTMHVDWDLRHVIGYLATWSPIKKYENAQGHHPLAIIAPLLEKTWGDRHKERAVRWPLYLRVGRAS